ncbi:hypothetical protein D3C74_272280 [compost metagenome]
MKNIRDEAHSKYLRQIFSREGNRGDSNMDPPSFVYSLGTVAPEVGSSVAGFPDVKY